MKKRATNSNSADAKNYCNRGIGICEEWKKYATFKDWALKNGYASDLSIDRIDNNRGYSPENCKWSTALEQANNKRTTSMISFNGRKIPRANFCRMFNLEYKKVEHLHYSRKLSGEEILSILLGDFF